MSVSALVWEPGGDEDEAIAGLLRDLIEDVGITPDQLGDSSGPGWRTLSTPAPTSRPSRSRRGNPARTLTSRTSSSSPAPEAPGCCASPLPTGWPTSAPFSPTTTASVTTKSLGGGGGTWQRGHNRQPSAVGPSASTQHSHQGWLGNRIRRQLGLGHPPGLAALNRGPVSDGTAAMQAEGFGSDPG